MAWPATHAEFLRSASEYRPIFMGDMFGDVPVMKMRTGGNPPVTDPIVYSERRTVMALTYPCEMYEGPRMTRVQSVAPLLEASRVGIGPEWRAPYHFCPVADPFGDGILWAVDFRTITPVDRAYLTLANRVAAVTEDGWATVRQRLTTYFSRVIPATDRLVEAGRAAWAEVELWERWNRSGRNSGEFQSWLDAPSSAGTIRRELLEEASDLVAQELRLILSGQTGRE